SLLSSSRDLSFHVGNGLTVTKTAIDHIKAAKHEVLFVTCFWNASCASLLALSAALRDLARTHRARMASGEATRRLRVRIAFSSLSLLQKLLHTSNRRGKIWTPDTWVNKLGLPSQQELEGLDVEVKSLFFRPVSVLHSKFTIIDRQVVVLASANISWENWLECSLTLHGDIVSKFCLFWEQIWGSSGELLQTDWLTPSQRTPPAGAEETHDTILLPQPWHQNPDIPFLRWVFPFWPKLEYGKGEVPPTPQNTFLLEAFRSATETIYIQTPNLTCRPVVEAIYEAVARGVKVEVVTCRNMMVLEQLVTAWGRTEWEVNKLIKRVRKLGLRANDEERALRRGSLKVSYFRERKGGGGGEGAGVDGRWEEKKSHVKCYIFDGEVVVLGSGNADRASWWTSLEVNVAVFGRGIAGEV
ncbi:hypothetical protein BJ508DRAFT_187348, partial [Ascobolus immersus RN42]